jgi:ribosome biogenesis GTPase
MIPGTVLRVDAKICLVDVGDEELQCRVRGRLHAEARRQRRPLAAGDRVRVRRTEAGEGVVESIEERHSKLSRPAADTRGIEQVVAANVDGLIVVSAVREPPLRRGFIDRLLVVAEREGLEPLIVINKIDLLDGAEEEVRDLVDVYRGLEYPVALVSAIEGRGVEPVREFLRGKSSVVVGQSGVGKSTLLNAVQPGLRLRTGEVSASTSKGRHTTTAAFLLRLEIGGYVVDTPGVREFGLWDVTPEDLSACFPEIRELLGACRFRGCSHTHEPGCAVKPEVGESIDPERFASYEKILASLLDPDAR